MCQSVKGPSQGSPGIPLRQSSATRRGSACLLRISGGHPSHQRSITFHAQPPSAGCTTIRLFHPPRARHQREQEPGIELPAAFRVPGSLLHCGFAGYGLSSRGWGELTRRSPGAVISESLGHCFAADSRGLDSTPHPVHGPSSREQPAMLVQCSSPVLSSRAVASPRIRGARAQVPLGQGGLGQRTPGLVSLSSEVTASLRIRGALDLTPQTLIHSPPDERPHIIIIPASMQQRPSGKPRVGLVCRVSRILKFGPNI